MGEAALADAVAKAFRAAILTANGQSWPDMFSKLHGKFSCLDHKTGLLFTAEQLGVVREVGEADRKKRKGEKRQEIVSLGRYKKTVLLTPLSSSGFRNLQEVGDALRTKIAELDLRWPGSPEEASTFADSLLDLVRATRSYKTSDGSMLTGGKTLARSYNAKNFLRMVLIALEAKLPRLFSSIEFERVSGWCPDQAGWSFKLPVGCDVQKLFGVSPLMFHCWCCMIAFASSDEQKAGLDASDDDIWRVFLDHEKRVEAGASQNPLLPHELLSALGGK